MCSSSAVEVFQERLLAWYERHGRHELPWRNPATPYRVWVSEIMLQQTRVATVIPYFTRFMARFPEIADLAAAPLEAVFQLWAGMGYYARARNLHRSAKQVMAEYGGSLPADLEKLCALPGIGRSTAGAILAIAFQKRAPILDGNVRRVLARWYGIRSWLGLGAVQRKLWELSDLHTPSMRVADYTQAIMDLGAIICTPRSPNCAACPLAESCRARQEGCVAFIHAPRPAPALPRRHWYFLLLRDSKGRFWLERNPLAGLWAGLWCFPRCEDEAALQAACLSWRIAYENLRFLPTRRHVFSHFRLDYTPVLAEVERVTCVAEESGGAWFDPQEPPAVPKPVARLLVELSN